MRNKLISLCLVAWVLAALPLTAAAREFDPNQTGSIALSLVSKNPKQPIAGAELSVYQVATAEIDGEDTLRYTYTDAFVDCGVTLDDAALTATLESFVSERNLPSCKIVTDAQGNAVCEDLPLGLYFVKQTGTVDGFAPCTSFLVTLPLKTDDGFQYDVDASPKTEVARLVNITIKKVWNMDKTKTIPGGVQVQLLRGERVVDTVSLNAGNHWQVTCYDLPESDGYSVKELNVPNGFTATYTRMGDVFTVTNTSTLIQTGQLIWPIPVLAVAGLLFLLTGFAVLRKSEGSDE